MLIPEASIKHQSASAPISQRHIESRFFSRNIGDDAYSRLIKISLDFVTISLQPAIGPTELRKFSRSGNNEAH